MNAAEETIAVDAQLIGAVFAVPVLYLILRFLEDLAGSSGSDPA